jgi:membrane-associated phospholipid phosphatase
MQSITVRAFFLWLATVFLLWLFGQWVALPSHLDREVLTRLWELRSGFGDGFFRAVTWAGSLVLLVPVLGLAAGWLRRQGWPGDAGQLAFSLAGTVAAVHLVKAISPKPRPPYFPPLVSAPWSASFPSAHTAQIVAVVTAACFILHRRRGCRRWTLTVLFALLAAAVGLSRLYLQVHFPGDVVAGAAYALGWGMVLEGLRRSASGGDEPGGPGVRQ